MYLTKKFIRINKVNISILLFLLCFTLVHIIKPSLIYNKEGGFRPFGLGYKHKTVIPIWIISIILAIFSYLAVLSYIMFL
jgi:hypothetical protein